jgi:peptide/nickel transport system substrate-binding protein
VSDELSSLSGLERDGLDRRELLQRAAAAGITIAAAGALGDAAFGATKPKRGGMLRVALSGGGTDSLDPHRLKTETQLARSRNLYNKLAEFNDKGHALPELAKEFHANRTARVWTIRLHKGVRFHSGKELTADDVIFSLRRMLDTSLGLTVTNSLTPFFNVSGISKIDRYTVRIRTLTPVGDLITPLADKGASIIPNGFTNFNTANGTGAFKLQSWTPGQQTLFVRNPHYWRDHGEPYVDQLQMLLIADSQARVNALLSGQVDAIQGIDAASVPVVRSRSNLRVLSSPTSAWIPLCMATQRPPFTDVRVRQAFRLMVDRAQMVSNVLLGIGRPANDLFCPFDPNFLTEPQRQHDPDRARALLKQAGQDGLKITLYTADEGVGYVNSAVVFAQQAKQAGVTVTVSQGDPNTYFDTTYAKTPFFVSDWGFRPLDSQILASVDSNAPFNETQWMNPRFDSLTRQARRTLDAAKRTELYHEAQKILWDQGGYIIWGFENYLDAYSSKVHGLNPSVIRYLSWYGFHKAWIT